MGNNLENNQLRKAQLRILQILIEVDKICKKHDIPYWLDYGTLLGAVRHQGFIPWDDDLDISVLKKDYQRLRELLSIELPKQFVFQDETTDNNYHLKFGKVRDLNTFLDDPLYRHIDIKHKGVYIDIFSIEPLPSKNTKKFIEIIYWNAFSRSKKFYKGKYKEYTGKLFLPFAELIVKFIRSFVSLVNSSKYYTSPGIPFFYEAEFDLIDIFPLKSMQFEGHTFFVPNHHDKHLTNLYGDYMKLPPIEKQIPEHGASIIFYD